MKEFTDFSNFNIIKNAIKLFDITINTFIPKEMNISRSFIKPKKTPKNNIF